MKKKILFTATVVKTHIMSFHLPYLKWFQEQGYETWVCARNDYKNKEDCKIPYCDHYVDLPFARNPLGKENKETYKQLKQLIEENDFALIHTHTPVGSVLTRMAARKKRKQGKTKVLYTAHGFHFYSGAPLLNWLLYYPVEKHCSRYTDALLVMNEEDYERAKKFPCKDVELVNGVGIDLNRIDSIQADKQAVRNALGLQDGDLLLLSVGELIKRKNHMEIMKTVLSMDKHIHYVICGDGILRQEYEQWIKENDPEHRIHLLGFRKDVVQLCKSADLFIFPSLQEGLPVALMEAMACGLPCIATDIRGNRDLIENGKGGLLVHNNPEEYIKAIETLVKDEQLRESCAAYNLQKIRKYDLPSVLEQVTTIYKRYLD